MAYYLFLAGVLCLAVATTILAVKVRRLENDLEQASMFLELFTRATMEHVKQLREATNLSPIKVEQE